MLIRTFSLAVCAMLCAGCGSDTPTGPTTDFIQLQSIVPAAGTVLVPGERVTFTAVLDCTIVSSDGGFTALVLQDQRNASLLDFDGRSPEATLRKGTQTVTLSQTITVPASGNTVNALFPIFVNGSDTTRALVTRNYTIR